MPKQKPLVDPPVMKKTPWRSVEIDGVKWEVIVTTTPTIIRKNGAAELPAAIIDYDACKIWLSDGPGQINALASAIVAIGPGGGKPNEASVKEKPKGRKKRE